VIDIASVMPNDPRVVYRDEACVLINAKWQDVIGELPKCDAVITDPPYGERTHSKQEHGRHLNQTGTAWVTARGISYSHWAAVDALAAAQALGDICSGWVAVLTSHDLVSAWSDGLGDGGRYVFAPLPAVQRGMNVRLAGDGPSSWTVWLVVARPRSLSKWGTLPGAYIGSAIDPGEMLRDKASRAVAGGKPLWLMRALVRDYSRPGDLVLDPCAGGATTLIAARLEGRRAIGIEMDPATCQLAAHRLHPYAGKRIEGQRGLFDGEPPP